MATFDSEYDLREAGLAEEIEALGLEFQDPDYGLGVDLVDFAGTAPRRLPKALKDRIEALGLVVSTVYDPDYGSTVIHVERERPPASETDPGLRRRSLFHATPKGNLASVLRQGLKPTTSRQSHSAPKVGRYGTAGKTYLALSLEDARAYAQELGEGSSYKTWSILEVLPPIPGTLYWDPLAYAVLTKTPIPASKIRFLEDFQVS